MWISKNSALQSLEGRWYPSLSPGFWILGDTETQLLYPVLNYNCEVKCKWHLAKSNIRGGIPVYCAYPGAWRRVRNTAHMLTHGQDSKSSEMLTKIHTRLHVESLASFQSYICSRCVSLVPIVDTIRIGFKSTSHSVSLRCSALGGRAMNIQVPVTALGLL